MEVIMSYLRKIVFRKKKKDKNAKVLNMNAKKNEAKASSKHISCDFNCKFNIATSNSNQKWNNETCQS